jgi:molybdenum cofactor cytidylyltransferase
MNHTERSASTVAGVVLAAGCSTRLGGDLPKQLLDFAGEPLVRRMVRTALNSRLSEVIVVVGHRSKLVERAYAGLERISGSLQTAYNSSFAVGQSTSVRCGLTMVAKRATGVVFMPIDQPFLTTSLIDRLIAAHEAGAALAVPRAAGQRGAPVLFARRFFPALQELSGDTGGRALLKSHETAITQVEVEDARQLMDLDTANDLHHLQALATQS